MQSVKIKPFTAKIETRFRHIKDKITHFILNPIENIVFFVAETGVIIIKNHSGGAAVEQIKQEIKEMIDEINNIWILQQVKKMLQNITR